MPTAYFSYLQLSRNSSDKTCLVDRIRIKLEFNISTLFSVFSLECIWQSIIFLSQEALHILCSTGCHHRCFVIPAHTVTKVGLCNGVKIR